MKRIFFVSYFFIFFTVSGLAIQSDEQEKNLPLIVVNPKFDNRNAPVAIIISGDGGWYKFEQGIADSLAGFGLPSIGLDTRKYFRNRRTPEETASDLAKSINHYNSIWHRSSYIFIGYSLGAELVPFIVNKLQDSIKLKVSMLVLLSPASTTDFQVHYSDMIGIDNKHDTYKVVDEINKIRTIPVLFIFGVEEKSQVPAMLTGPRVLIATVPGDHRYNRDASIIVKTMKDHRVF
ncbi:MAG TPA: AcvB/VirJ family lysyl-phosphatidylglycerol hydrolase [Bacteroidales bacterium]|nr:AcvB/VirJ family lysyl-phosphatidylglycerol hydrolase [Bacteroidales bacterium]